MMTPWGQFGGTGDYRGMSPRQLEIILALKIAVVAFAVTLLCLSLFSGCCACPPAPDQWRVDSPLDSNVLSSMALDSTLWADAGEWRGLTDTIHTIDESILPRMDEPTVFQELNGPWPCRWVYGVRREISDPVVAAKTGYQVIDGQLLIDNAVTVSSDLMFRWTEVRDSVWHCGGDGEFRK
jgi:hypothetical protein